MSLSAKKLALIQARLAAKGLRSEAEAGIPARKPGQPGVLSFAQERLWFFGQLSGPSAVFNIPAAYRIDGPLDPARLEQATRVVIERQESLRTAFTSEEGRPKPVVLGADFETPLEVVELHQEAATPGATGAPGELASQALELARLEAQRPFDLNTAPLIRLTLYVLSPSEHLLLVNVHHIVSEVQSVGLFAAELAGAYSALERGEDPALPELPIQFADFAAWQRSRMQGERYAEQLSWWQARLGGELPTLQLPTDRKPPAVQSFAGATLTRELPAHLAVGLRELCRAKKVSVFSASLALWSALLGRYSSQEDILVGVPVTDRNREEVRHLIGFFVNTLVMRSDLSDRPSFEQLLGRVDELHRDAQSNQEIPFDRLVEELGVQRELSHGPIFQAAFLYQTADESGAELLRLGEGATLRALDDPLAVHTGTSKFALSLILWDAGDQLSASLEYNSDLFNQSSMQRLLGHFEALLAGALAEPQRPLAELSILSPAEEQLILGDWNQTQAPLPSEPVHVLFEAQASATPDALALAAAGVEWTYGALNAQANRLAHRLQGSGVAPGDVLAIAAGRTPEMVLGMLATLKLGAAYLPLDLEYPAERLAYQLEHSQARAVLTLSDLEPRLPLAAMAKLSPSPECLALDRIAAELEAQPTHNPELPEPVSADHLAYVIYTSGSTGKPKGVAIEHRGLANLLSWHQRNFGVTPADRASHLAGLAFDAAVWEMWPYLTAGSSLHLVPEDVRLAPEALLAWLQRERITQGFLPTPLCEALLQLELPAEMPLEVVFTGGDKLRQAPGSTIPFRLNNNYGPTENSVVATSGDVDLGAPADQAPTIGKPIDNVQAYILDAALQPVPVGVPGELFVGGASLARGYHLSPELTAERFLESPFDPTQRLYRTGDLVAWREDGEIVFLGRMDGQVKVRGFRIELGEIETVLGAHPGVQDCAVQIQRNARGDGSLVGYVVLGEGAELGVEALRAHLAERLPEYMLPTSFLFLERLPLTPNGKLDRKALPQADLQAIAEVGFEDPEGEYEQRIAQVWCQVLELERVGARTNFFDLGGHSLLLARVHAELVKLIDKPLTIVELFRFPTVRSLAEHLASEGPGSQEELDGSRARGARRREAAARGRGRRRR